MERGNGDPSLAILAPYSPNHVQLARQFVTLDNFYDSGETSNTGWNWTTAARSTDFTEKTSPVNYAGRGLTYDWEGVNRNINVGLPTVQQRQAAQPTTPSDPDLLPGTADVAAPDSAGEAGEGYVIGPYVKHRALDSEHYTTVSMLRTIEDVLGMESMGLNDGLAEPMAEIFDPRQREWTYRAIVPETLYTTQLPLPPRNNPGAPISAAAQPKRDAAYWDKAMGGQNFTVEDNLDEPRFNRALWSGLKGEDIPFPTSRHGRDMRKDREKLLLEYEAAAQTAQQ